jgi:hypothetical protein
VARNFTLLGAAGVAGLHWSVLRALRVPLGALIVSHVAWDIWIFLVQPTGETGPGAEQTATHEAAAAFQR